MDDTETIHFVVAKEVSLQTCVSFVASLTAMLPFLAQGLIKCLPLFVFFDCAHQIHRPC